jgi:hypothetical protein
MCGDERVQSGTEAVQRWMGRSFEYVQDVEGHMVRVVNRPAMTPESR